MSNFYTCIHCGKSIEISQKDIHENFCLYVPKKEEFDDLIPCEICNNFINFSDYQEHTETCGIRRTQSINNIMSVLSSYINQINNPENQESLDNNQEENEESDGTNNVNQEVEPMDIDEPELTPDIINEEIEPELDSDVLLNLPSNNVLQSLFSSINQSNILTITNPVYNIPYNSLSDVDHLPSSGNLFDTIDNYANLTNLSDQIGDVEVGIENLDNVLDSIKLEEETICPICQNNHLEIKRTKCNHDFCDYCISTWLSRKKTCPICLKDLDEN